MKWVVDFYSERRAIVARYAVDAESAASAVLAGRRALFAAHPPIRTRRRPSLFELAERIGGQDDGGWRLYRILKP